MKKIVIILLLTNFIFGCKSEKKENHKPSTQKLKNQNSSLVTDFLNDITNLESSDSKTVIADFKNAVTTLAVDEIAFTKENIQSILDLAKKRKHCVIITGNHTIVKIKDINDCKPSGSWSACMPSSVGYVKKGTLKKQDNYLNYIIGTPDNQERIAYFFN